MTQQHADPAADAVARVAQLAAMAITIGEAAARLRAEQEAHRADRDARAAELLRAQARAQDAAARLDSSSPAGAAVDPGPLPQDSAPRLVIVCTPRDLADQAFPVPMTEAMATAPAAAARVVRVAATGPRPSPTALPAVPAAPTTRR